MLTSSLEGSKKPLTIKKGYETVLERARYVVRLLRPKAGVVEQIFSGKDFLSNETDF